MQLLRILFLENSSEGLVVIFVLLLLLAIAIHFAIRHTRRYRHYETGLLNRVIWVLNDLGRNQADSDPSFVLEQLIVCLPRDRKGQLQESIIGNRLLALQKMRTSHAKINIVALQEMSVAREAALPGLSFPSFVVGFAMLLGLLGTVIGLTKMVQTIDMTLPTATSNLTQSLQNVSNVLSSMKSAFSATLVGLFCSITASLLNLRLEKAQSAFFEKLERFTLEELLPKTSPTMEDEVLLEKVNRQMERYFDELREVAEQNNQTIQDLSAAQKAFDATIANIEQMSRGNSPGSVQEVLGYLTGVIGELSGVNRSIVTLTDRLPETLDVARQANQTMQKRVDSLLDSNKQWQTRIETSLSDMTRALPNLLNKVEQGKRTGEVKPALTASFSRSQAAPRRVEETSLSAPLSQRTFLIYSAAMIIILVMVFIWLR